jgi:hypothetical protein
VIFIVLTFNVIIALVGVELPKIVGVLVYSSITKHKHIMESETNLLSQVNAQQRQLRIRRTAYE